MTAAVVIVVASVGFIVYVLAVYPLLLSLWAKARPRPIRKTALRTRVSIVVPVRNGARWIEAKIRSLLETNYPDELIDVLIVSDGSTDGSDALVSAYPDARVRLLALPAGGKAVAVNRGIESVSGEIVVLTDVRQTFDRDAIPKLLACFAEPGVGVVTGELVIREGASREEYNTGLYWRYEKWIRRNLNRIDAMLGATGSIYAIRRELAPRIPAEILLDDVYVPFALLSAALASFFLPDPWRILALVSQGIFYGLALADPVIPERSRVKRLSATIRAFVVLTAAAGCALAVFVLPARQLWKETRPSAVGR